MRPVRRPRTDRLAAVILGLFLIGCAITGGSARADAVQLLFLRPFTVVCLVALLLLPVERRWSEVRVPLVLLGLWAAVILIQLVPLPPMLWQELGARDLAAETLRLVGGRGHWEPLSLTPDRTWNSALALLVPATVLVGYAGLSDRYRSRLLPFVLGLAGVSILLGAAQMAGGPMSGLYYYEFMNRGLPNGFLANRNHTAALLASLLPLLRVWTLPRSGGGRDPMHRRRQWIALGMAALIVITIVITGSRAGLGLLFVGMAAAYLVRPPSSRELGGRRWAVIAIPAVGLLVAVGLLLVAILSGRALSIDRLQGVDILETEMRVAAAPTVLELIGDSMPMGTGYGSFVTMFNSREPDTLLKPTYFNNAHNDLLEVALTGGVPALIVVVLFLLWWARSTYYSFIPSKGSSYRRRIARASGFTILILLLASLTDYPLRTPAIAAFFAVFCTWLLQVGRQESADNAVAIRGRDS